MKGGSVECYRTIDLESLMEQLTPEARYSSGKGLKKLDVDACSKINEFWPSDCRSTAELEVHQRCSWISQMLLKSQYLPNYSIFPTQGFNKTPKMGYLHMYVQRFTDMSSVF